MGGSSSKVPESESEYEFNKKQFQISPATNTDMCMSYSSNGVRVVNCEDLPEQYWGLKAFQAIARSASQSKSAGGEAIGDGEDANGNEGGAGNELVADPNTVADPSIVAEPNTVVDPSTVAEPTQSSTGESFKGYITHKGIGFHVSFIDIAFFAIIAYIIFKLLK